MQFADCVRSRKMVRSFRSDPVAPELVERIVELASRAPSAGKTQGWHFLVLQGAETSQFWDTTLPAKKRSSFKWKHLLDAPIIGLVFADSAAYVARYSESDKSSTGLGNSESSWPTPYWTVDASFATMTLLLAAHDVGLGALFFAVFSGEDELRELLNVPTDLQLIGAVAMGWPRTQEKNISGLSASRTRRTPAQITHFGKW
ncbi:putative NADH dehydrogenase/NAD(P)H nitroreductase [Acidimicrobiaceae bacterium]|nr:putative NADH dehydrogenase/NAD(P)H nitroreductase [Acidimicrobiaceae bacterium]